MASIYLRGKIWWISFYPHQGSKPIQRSLKTPDKTVAKFKKNELENQLAKGESPIPNFNLSPFIILKEYEESCRNKNKHRTVSDDIQRIKDFLSWGNKQRIKDITDSDVSSYLNGRLDKEEIVTNTANHYITNLKTFLNFAVRRGYISNNPLKGFKKYQIEKLPPRFLKKDEIRKVLAASENEPIHIMIATAIYTGMRYGELKRLTWGDIDFDRNEIIVRLSKSKRFRIIPLHPTLSLDPQTLQRTIKHHLL